MNYNASKVPPEFIPKEPTLKDLLADIAKRLNKIERYMEAESPEPVKVGFKGWDEQTK